uniref:protein-serine/threonine phosphatase n=1 Tax=Peronospora matthiolae TaxID=2874970 RepID=A0AAV1TZB7_9STRA
MGSSCSCSRDHSRVLSSVTPRHKCQLTDHLRHCSSLTDTHSSMCVRVQVRPQDRCQCVATIPSAPAAPEEQRPSPAWTRTFDEELPSPFVRDYAAVSTQNCQFRKHMEDACVAILKFRAFPDDPAVSSFFGVYDGHGGDFCAKYAAKHFHWKLAELMQVKHDTTKGRRQSLEGKSNRNRSDETTSSCSDKSSDVSVDVLRNEEVESCYVEAFAALDEELQDFDESSDSGSTAVTCLIRRFNGRTTFYVANVGDSRAIFCCDGQTLRLSVDHKATNQDEVERIRALNGIIVNKRVAGSISVTRALGQADEKKFITSAPHIVSLEIASDDAILMLVSDGITDVFRDEELTEFVAKHLAEGEKSVTIGNKLLDEAKAQGSTDNMTAVIICFGERRS